MTDRHLTLLTGATGYVGGRLRRMLEQLGVPLRCLARRSEYLRSRVGPRTEVVQGDVLAPETLGSALTGVHTAYYLIHSMSAGADFEERDRRGAEAFSRACQEAGVKRIVYLGGLGRSDEALSAHLRSRQEVGRILARSGVPVVELRASIVIGSGSLSFEMVRSLVERLPVMITPRWVQEKAQPIAIEDLLSYLVGALEVPSEGHRVFEIGGADRVSYGEIMREYARQRGLRRFMVPVPVLTPRLSGYWLGLVTPVYAGVGRKLIDSIRHPTVVEDESARAAFDVDPMGISEAIARALDNEDREIAETRWNDTPSATVPGAEPGEQQYGHRLVDDRSVVVAADSATAFAPIRRIGGDRGWYFGNVLWWLRGLLDLLVGGPGLRRGRRDPENLAAGDALDFWRVEEVVPDRLLRLRAEMKLPGRAWLQFEVVPSAESSVVRQTALFDPVGLLGRAYWYGIYPIHVLVFAGMLRAIGSQAERIARGRDSTRRWLLPTAVGVALSLSAGGLGGIATATSVGSWYTGIDKPAWNPPDWVFGPVWTLLFVLMGVAAGRVWSDPRGGRVAVASLLFLVQLALNVAWSVLFFGLRSPGLALAEIVGLVVAIALTTTAFARLDRAAGLLLLPYLGWVLFATALNFEIWRLNS